MICAGCTFTGYGDVSSTDAFVARYWMLKVTHRRSSAEEGRMEHAAHSRHRPRGTYRPPRPFPC